MDIDDSVIDDAELMQNNSEDSIDSLEVEQKGTLAFLML
jgi:hypothetical protein